MLRERCGAPPAPYERAQLERWTAPAAAALGPAATAEATAAGRALSVDDAVAAAHRALRDPGRAAEPVVLPPLTPRQSEVAGLVADGLSNAEVAARLGLAVPTVQRHLASAYLATGVRSRTQLAAWVRQPR